MFKPVFLLCFLIHHAFPDCQCGLRSEFERALIHGGRDAQPGEYPWQACIITFRDRQPYICGGSIINTEWILTAAHCLPDFSTLNNDVVRTDIFVRVGRVDNKDLNIVLGLWKRYWFNIGPRPDLSTLKENGLYLVDSLVPHKECPNETSSDTTLKIAGIAKYSADIALLHVQTPFKFSSTVTPVCLEPPRSVQNFYPIVEIAGWGSTTEKSDNADVLKRATVSEVKFENCSWHTINPLRQMCFNRGSPGSCPGDSGSPYVVKKNGQFYQIAIVSRGDKVNKCSEKSAERIGIRVAYFYNWIKKMVNSGIWCSP